MAEELHVVYKLLSLILVFLANQEVHSATNYRNYLYNCACMGILDSLFNLYPSVNSMCV